MTREELEKRLESAEKQMLGLQDEIQNLKSKLAYVHDEHEIPEIPEFDRPVVWAMDSKLDVFYYGISPYNESSFNAFHSKEYAQEFADKCKLIAMMLHCKWYLDRDYVPNWNDRNEVKWDVYFDSSMNKFLRSNWRHAESPCVYFSSDVAAKKCAEWLNEHWRDGDAD